MSPDQKMGVFHTNPEISSLLCLICQTLNLKLFLLKAFAPSCFFQLLVSVSGFVLNIASLIFVCTLLTDNAV